MKAFTLSYCILCCSVWLSSLGDLLFFEEEMERGESVKRRGRQELCRVEGGERGLDVFYETRIYFF